MNRRPLVVLVVAVLAISVCGASGKGLDTDLAKAWRPQADTSSDEAEFRGTRLDTLWIFNANFEDLEGHNAGWTSYDNSGTLGVENYWHHDTIHMLNLPQLGDSTWWCGTENACWRQPRGYGNNWIQILERSFPEVAANTDAGDPLYLDFDQRFALEHDYDYGYVEISNDGGNNWTEVHLANNPGFASLPGTPKDWTSDEGHIQINLSSYAGQDVDLRFRFESDEAYSAEDELNNPPTNSVKDGAWQIDNITWSGGTPAVNFWIDNAESGNMGWVHDDTPATGQIGATWWRGQYDIDFETGRDFTCNDRPAGSWMYGAVDPFTSEMQDNQWSWLMSPPISISGAPKLVGKWDFWVDAPPSTGDLFNLYLATDDIVDCVQDPGGFIDEAPGWWYVEPPGWYTVSDDWDAFAGNEWLAILWAVRSDTTDASGLHYAGMYLNRQMVGIPSGDAGTSFEHHDWLDFNDWFQDDLEEALLDTASIKIKDDDGIVSANVVASSDGGQTWEYYACRRQDAADPENFWWYAPPPWNQMVPGSVIRYYFEATDGVGTIATEPSRAPDRTFEMSILPIAATTTQPGILIVDKDGYWTPGAQRYNDVYHRSEYYYREMLEILGYEYETYDVEVPTGSRLSDGPDTTGMKYYNTQIWFMNNIPAYTLNRTDQRNLREWLSQSAAGKERNLLVTGNNTGYELIDGNRETLAFYET